ncbi:Protein Brevis radix-like 1 [Striga hermonthica]|uniref:Protein Brevis radix-like 1 n=1 Tax=Striga hermonthica TaxID=68872 RepID=A0A9N7MSI0_STRHE|nr:Protein Brevis radix-like 1 [Striga hermonthica]
MALKVSGAHKGKPDGMLKKVQRPYPDFDSISERVPYTYVSSSSTPAWDFPITGHHRAIRPDPRFTAFGGMESISAQSGEVVLEDEDGPKEWMAQVEPGVQITFVSLPRGGNDLKRIRFSREMFNKWEAQRWWGENYDRIMELYNVQRFNQQAPNTPGRSDDGRDSTYSRLGSTRESPWMSTPTPVNNHKEWGPRYKPSENVGGQMSSSQQHTVEGEQEMRKRSTRKSSAAALLASPPAPPSAAAPRKRSPSLSPAESPAVKFDFNLDGLAEIASALKKKKSNKNGSAVASNSKRMQPTGFSTSPPRSLKSVNTISDLKDLASSNLESIKRQLELSHSEILKDIEASESRLQKRFKIQTQACQHVIDEAEKEYKKISARINEGREAMKDSYEEFIAEAQTTASRQSIWDLIKCCLKLLKVLRIHFREAVHMYREAHQESVAANFMQF